MPSKKENPAVLILEDGTVFFGTSCGAEGEVFGEVVINTAVTGYQEIASDPSYAGQIVALTYPHVGNCGVNAEDMQSRGVFCRGLIVRDMCDCPSSYRSTASLTDFLKACRCVAIEGIDVTGLAQHIREKGSMRAVISTADDGLEAVKERLASFGDLNVRNFIEEVSTAKPYTLAPFNCGRKYRVVAYDFGIKTAVLSGMASRGCEVCVVPWDTPAESVLEMDPDGVVLSGGPGDPEVLETVRAQVRELVGKKPIFGIGLGHQLLCLAAGGHVEKLDCGRQGANCPVVNLLAGTVESVALSNGFYASFESLGPLVPELSGNLNEHPDSLLYWVEHGVAPVVESSQFGRVQLTHVDPDNGMPQGVRFLDCPAFSAQFHPEGAPGPRDCTYLFQAFMNLMDGKADYLGSAADESQVRVEYEVSDAPDPVDGWKIFDVHAMRDEDGAGIVMYAGERFGVSEKGSVSIMVVPTQTLTDVEYRHMLEVTRGILEDVGTELCGVDVRFAVNSENGYLTVVEKNPCGIESSVFSTLLNDGLANQATGCVATVISRSSVKHERGSAGDIIAIGETFEESLDEALNLAGMTAEDVLMLEGVDPWFHRRVEAMSNVDLPPEVS